jgi:hypothetical protein
VPDIHNVCFSGEYISNSFRGEAKEANELFMGRKKKIEV